MKGEKDFAALSLANEQTAASLYGINRNSEHI
jgi:hypothetical protein